LNVRGLFALRTLGHFELDLLAFFQGLETTHLNGGEMRAGTLIANRLRPTGGLSGGKWTLDVTIRRRTFVSLPVP
jgi:hypothetical protein